MKFAYVKHDFYVENILIKQYEIGIVKEELPTYSKIHFIKEDLIAKVGNDDFESFNPYKTGDGFPKKVCNVCHRLLDTVNFSRNQNGKNNRIIRRPSCNECREVIDGVNMSAAEKKKWNKIKPHMQLFKCPICHKITVPGLTSKVVLDHNHHTGKGRGWICDSCNTRIGRFKEDITLLKNAIKYIEADEKKN